MLALGTPTVLMLSSCGIDARELLLLA